MFKRQHVALAAAGLMVAACASDPYYDSPRYVSSSTPVYDAPRYDNRHDGRYYAQAPAYADGRVVAIDVVRREGGIGAGAVVGGIIGGVLGHQVGSGRGNDLATAAGAVGGAVAGHQIEKNRAGGEQYRVIVQMRDGREASFLQDSLDGIRVGDRVRVDGGRLIRD
jgi:outer membrane lipoprotein SlyB